MNTESAETPIRNRGTIQFDERGAAIDPPGPIDYGVWHGERVRGEKAPVVDTVELHARVAGWYWSTGEPFRWGRTADGVVRQATWTGDLPD